MIPADVQQRLIQHRNNVPCTPHKYGIWVHVMDMHYGMTNGNHDQDFIIMQLVNIITVTCNLKYFNKL